MAPASPQACVVLYLFMCAYALQNQIAHRTAGQAGASAHRHSSHLDGTAAGGAHRSISGQANIFTDVLDKFGWSSSSKPGDAAEIQQSKNETSRSSDSTSNAASVSTRADVESASVVTSNGSGNHSRASEVSASLVAGSVLANASADLGGPVGVIADALDRLPTGHQTAMKASEQAEVEADAIRASGGTSELKDAGESVGDAPWKEDLTSGVAFTRTTQTCTPGQQHCKSLCRWLKLTDKDFDGATIDSGSCPLFDWSMESSGYTPPLSRKHLSSPEPVDCATDFLHQNVQRKDVGTYVLQLEECMVGLPQEDSEKYSAPLKVVATEITGWKKEQVARESAALIELRLQEAIEQGRKAFFTKIGVADAAGNLTSVMRKTKGVDDGHYVFDDIRTGRELLEKLQPIVLAQKGLASSEARGQEALEHKVAAEVKGAVVLLNVSIASAEALGVVDQAKSAKHVRDELTGMQELMSQIHIAFLQANVSVRTKLHTEEAIEKMNKTLAKAKAAKIVAPLSDGHRLVAELTEIAEAKDELKIATKNAQAALQDEGGQDSTNFLDAMNALQNALARASQLHLTAHVTSDAVRLMASLEESKAARQALRTATLHANAVALDPSSLNFTSEDAAIAELSGSVSWAEHAHLQHSMPVAKELLKMLSVLRDAKVRMTNSISVGDASLQATAGQENAIDVLSKSMREAKALNMTAGTFSAKEQLKKLRRQVDARDGLERAVARAGRKLRAKKVRLSALKDLNASITQAADSGLKDEVVLAQQQLERLRVLKDALDDIHVAIRLNPPERSAPQLFSVSDPERAVKVAVPKPVTELKTTDLPEVLGSRDDGDADFAEHILRLNRSIANAKHFSLVDPEMLEQVAQLQKFQAAWDMLNASTQEGRSALKMKEGLYKATVHVEDAIQLAQGVGLKVGVKKAKHLVSELQTIPDIKNEVDAAVLQGKIALKFKLGIHDALVRLNAALDESKPFGLMGKEKKAEKLRSTLLAVNEAWLQLRAATVQGAVALRLEHSEDAAIDVLQSAIAKADSAGLSAETPGAAQLLGELRHMNEAHQSIESAVVPGVA